MRILQLGKYHPPTRGGMETVLGDLCAGLRVRGHDVTVLVHGEDAVTRREPLCPECPGTGTLVRLGVRGTLASQPLSPGYLGELRRLLAAYPPELILLHWPNPLSAVALLAVRDRLPAGCRLAVWYHADITRQRLGGRLLRPLLSALLNRCDGIAVSTASLRDGSPALAGREARVRVIPFGIDASDWTPSACPGEGPLLFVGRLVYYKGLELLLDVLALAPHRELELVGDGPLRSTLARRAADPDLQDRVRCHGELGDSALRELMGRCGALVLPSLCNSETFGLVQLEAMAAGLPVISTELSTGVAEVNLDGVTGRLAAPGDSDALQAAIADVYADPVRARTWGAAGRRRVLEHYALDDMVTAVESWFAELVDGRA